MSSGSLYEQIKNQDILFYLCKLERKHVFFPPFVHIVLYSYCVSDVGSWTGESNSKEVVEMDYVVKAQLMSDQRL